VFLLL